MELEQAFDRCLPYLIAYYLNHHPAGHNLHIVLSDNNVDDESLWFCQEQCEQKGDLLGLLIATTFRHIPEYDREKTIEHGKYAQRIFETMGSLKDTISEE